MEKLKKCHFNCGDTDLDKHTCGCYNDWLQENKENMENKHTLSEEDKVDIMKFAAQKYSSGYLFGEPIFGGEYEPKYYAFQSGAEWGISRERERLQSEIDRLKEENSRLQKALDGARQSISDMKNPLKRRKF